MCLSTICMSKWVRTETYTDRCPFECIHVEKKWRRGDCVRMCVCVCSRFCVCLWEQKWERGCECQSERKTCKREEEWSVCYVSVCVCSVGLQINPVGFILSEWDSGALQWLSLEATDDCFEFLACPTLPRLPACALFCLPTLLAILWRSVKVKRP